MEIKCCNLVIRGEGFFPDSVSSRATRHVRELIHARSQGFEPWVVFMITRPDATACLPFGEADPQFAAAMSDAVAAGVQILALTHRVTLRGISLAQSVPFRLQ